MAKKSAKGPSQPKNANYDFAEQNQPINRMGANSFANLPDKPMMRPYGHPSASYMRDGLDNSFTADLEDVSGIAENCK
jgi:hypothetical protein